MQHALGINERQRQPYMRMLLAGMEQTPFMYGIADPDGEAHFDECCVSKSIHGVDEAVSYLNAEYTEEGAPLYQIVPLYRQPMPPTPVAVPDKWPEKLTWSHHDDMTQAEVMAWNNAIDACRAAMLQGGKS